jgi:hypothetical protein
MDRTELIPPVVYLACGHTERESFVPDRRTTEDGRVALLVYSALDRLLDCCGVHQPWVVVPTEKLDEIDRYAPYDVILLDTEIPAELRREVA